ncbi:MAG TPA: zinc ribbon domain-containing protein [Tepidisphaeraceae bacterium]
MIRHLFLVASLVSLAIGPAVVWLWARSDDRRDELPFRWHGVAYALASDRGRVGIDNVPQQREFLAARDRAIADVDAAKMAFRGGPADTYDPYLASMVQANNRLYALLGQGPPAPRRYVVSHWLILLAALVLPIALSWKWHKRQVRRAAGQCGECGYDLRASTGRCPECGTRIPVEATA